MEKTLKDFLELTSDPAAKWEFALYMNGIVQTAKRVRLDERYIDNQGQSCIAISSILPIDSFSGRIVIDNIMQIEADPNKPSTFTLYLKGQQKICCSCYR